MNAMHPIGFSAIEGWEHDDHAEAFEAFLRSAKRMATKPYKTRALGEDAITLAAIGKLALEMVDVDQEQAKSFFETYFSPALLIPDNGESAGFMTGFFEPEVAASLTKSDAFPEPIYARPPELLDLNDHNRPASLDSSWRYGWQSSDGIVVSPDRAAINAGALEGRGLEIAYVRNRVDAFFVHVQGAAKLKLSEGGFRRITYAGKTGHPYTSLGKLLCQRLNVTLAEMTSDILRDWMLDNPDSLDELLAHNRSYIFFEVSDEATSAHGPIAAAKVPLMRHRSLAVDRTIHTFGVPFFVSTKEPLPGDSAPFRKLMIAQDTGSAITGTARGDIFCGTGSEAGLQGGRIQHAADMIVLMPRADRLGGA